MLKKYWEKCPECNSNVDVDVDAYEDPKMPREGCELLCQNEGCGVTGSVSYMGAEDHFAVWDL